MLVLRTFLPSAALLPFVKRYYTISGEHPEDAEQYDIILHEMALVRIIVQGAWSIEAGGPGHWADMPSMAFSGPGSSRTGLRVRGPFHAIGAVFRPSGWPALFDRPANEFADRILPFSDVWGAGADRLQDSILQLSDEDDIIRAFEDEVVLRLNRIGTWQVHAAMEAFESIARTDCSRQVRDVAAQLGLSPRQFERSSLSCFGHTPKLVLRRSRFLDMATAMRGIGDPSEEQLAELRYFDQSHRNREFRQFIGMTPQQFVHTPLPFFSAGLQARFQRKASRSEFSKVY